MMYWPGRLHRVAGRYAHSVSSRFLAPIDCSKIPAQVTLLAMAERGVEGAVFYLGYVVGVWP